MTGRVLVTHPGRQHSHQNALALERTGMLGGYWSGVPSVGEHLETVRGRLLGRFVRYPTVSLPPSRALWAARAPVLRRTGDLLLPRPLADRVDFAACRTFDRWAARRLRGLGARGVIACEISALETFRTAKSLGWTTFLDAPSFHHTAQDRLHGFSESPTLHRRIVAVKDAEIDLADHVLTVSELARQTYVDAGLEPDRVHAVPLGADLELFSPDGPFPASDGTEGDRVRFLFAGASIHRKGFDLLLPAFEQVARDEPSACLRVVGPAGDSAHLLDRCDLSRVTVRGSVTQADLAAELRRADCLVLPSRNDSFGMVVAEALASGTPVIVSEMVGAKDLIEEGVSGWIVPTDDVDALARRMIECARDRPGLRAMAPAARQAAERATWDAYHLRFAALVASLVGTGSTP